VLDPCCAEGSLFFDDSLYDNEGRSVIRPIKAGMPSKAR
jgi:hypothetical protein